MPRPHVQITAPNQLEALRRHLDAVLPRLAALPGVVGITLNGGMSRGYADALSEIDVTLYLTPAAYATWQRGRAPVGLGITVIDGALYDLKSVDLEAERARAWEPVALWDASYAEILYDPEGRVAVLLQEKLAERPDPGDAAGPLFRCWWYFRLAGDIWVQRGDALQGHQMLNQAVVPLVEALFLANAEFVPHEKWLLHMSRSLAWTPERWEARLGEALRTGDLTIASVQQRQAVIAALWDEVDRHVARAYPDLPVRVMQKHTYELLKALVDAGSMPVADWEARAGLATLNGAPFHGIATIEGDSVVVDREALLNTGPEAMYAWHYEVLQAVRDEHARRLRAAAA